MAPVVHALFSALIVFGASVIGGAGLAVVAATAYIVYAIFATRGDQRNEKDSEVEK